MSQLLGNLSRLRRYPVKSMAGEELKEAYVQPERGIVGDRLFGYHLVGSNKPGVSGNYLTARKAPELLLCQPSIVDEPTLLQPYPQDYQAKVMVQLPPEFGLGQFAYLDDPALLDFLKRKYGFEVEVDNRGSIFDQKAISLLGMPSLRALEDTINYGRSESDLCLLDPLRFRENMYIDWEQEAGYEERLLNNILRIGEQMKIRVEEPTGRCVMVNFDSHSAEKDSGILKAIGALNKGKFGVYCSVVEPGVVRVGDEVYLEEE